MLPALGALAIIGAAIAIWAAQDVDRIPAAEVQIQDPRLKPRLALLTSLPILFGERFGLDGGDVALPAVLGATYDVQPIAVADTKSLAPYRLLLMAHPRAQPAGALVDLDAWVRGGGRLLLLADPRLDWHSDRPIGDRLRPPPSYADTGLLSHWGLDLVGPTPEGTVPLNADGLTVFASSPGRLLARDRRCRLAGEGFIARCGIGAGAVIVIADADLLNVGGPDALEGPTSRNLELITRELARLAR